ncbi:interleukin 10 receptor subunit beta S homeolog isoform X1 [Xenopus laevis]|uniref:Interleukin 10 receptor subunit beta S homeolog isoform X1 n=1 Tax=Xenopus laevis TaxID=8355 RepID=A0A8J1MC11_XENLA|nr:interleukin 10 receptor subunit beta S homeolog isoform X1 [Xenopus laevis]
MEAQPTLTQRKIKSVGCQMNDQGRISLFAAPRPPGPSAASRTYICPPTNVQRATKYNTICQTNDTHCDLSVINYKSIVRVRAELNGSISKWVMISFNPYPQTVITAPEVKVASRAGDLDVSFFGPMRGSDGTSLRDIYGSFKYKLLYWRQSEPSVVTSMDSLQNFETLANLDKWTDYCIRVQAYAPDYNNTGELSQAICEKTTNDGFIPGWKISLAFLIPLCLSPVIIVGLFYLGSRINKVAKYLFVPKYSFPEHLKEYLSQPFYSPPHLTQGPDDGGDPCGTLTLVSEENLEV